MYFIICFIYIYLYAFFTCCFILKCRPTLTHLSHILIIFILYMSVVQIWTLE